MVAYLICVIGVGVVLIVCCLGACRIIMFLVPVGGLVFLVLFGDYS